MAAPSTPAPPACGRRRDPLSALKWWLGYATFCTLAGWTLSIFHALTAVNWIIAAVAAGAIARGLRGKRQALVPARPALRVRLRALVRRRFRRPLPLLFAILTACTVSRGLFNWRFQTEDVQGYRLPRLLHWVYEHGWHWIPTVDARMNTRGCGFEWMAAPFLLIAHSERFVFVLTTLAFCLLPALTFLLFRELGVRARAAWAWSWVLPTGYCYLFQAGTLCIDIVGAAFAMAAVALALRARREQSFALFVYSVVAAGLMTNQKASNLPLLLPLAVAWALNLPVLRRHYMRSGLAVLLGLAVSFLPLAVQNRLHTGGFTGLEAEPKIYRPAPPAAALAANTVLVGAYAVAPPLLTPRGKGANVFEFFHSPALMEFLRRNFEGRYGMLPKVTDEDLGGLGLGVTLLLLWRLGIRSHGAPAPASPGSRERRLVRLASWLALIFIGAKSTLFALPRLLGSYYPLVLPSFLQGPGAVRAVRQRGWRRVAAFHSLLCAGLLCLLTSTPVWPLRLAPFLERRLGRHPFLQSLFDTYGTNPRVQDFYEALAASLPPHEPVIGLLRNWDETELYFWEPIGSRKIEHVLPGDDRLSLLARGSHYVILSNRSGEDPNRVCERLGASVQQEYHLTGPRIAPIQLYLLQLNGGRGLQELEPVRR
jgi:hypothetical protein